MGNTGWKINFPSIGIFGGTVEMDAERNISASAEANANVYGIYTVGAKVAVDENMKLSGGCKAAIDLNPIAKAELNINVDKYCKFNTIVYAKINVGLIKIGGHAEINQNGQKSAGFDIHSTMASNESIGGNVEIDKNGETSGGVSVEKKFDKFDVVIEKKVGKRNFSRTTNEGPGQLTGERSGNFVGSVDKIGDTNNQTDLMDKLMQTMDVNLGTEHLTYGRRDDVGSCYNFGDTNHKSDLLDTFMRARDDKFSRPIILSNLDQNTKPVNVGTEHLTYGRSDEVGSLFQGFGSRSPFTLPTQKSGWLKL